MVVNNCGIIGYKEKRLSEVRYYLRGIRNDGTFPNFTGPLGEMFNTKPLEKTCERYDIDNESWVKVDEQLSDCDIDEIMKVISIYRNDIRFDFFKEYKSMDDVFFEFGDKREKYRFKRNKRNILIKKFLFDVKGLYNELKDIDIEFATNEVEVEESICKFENKLKQLLVEFEKEFLNLYQKETGYKVKRNGISLKNIKIKIRSREELEKLSKDDLHNNNEFNGFIEAFKCIYTLTCMIKDKYEKLERFRDKAVRLYPVSKNERLLIKAIKGMRGELDKVPYDNFQFAFCCAYYIDIYNIVDERPVPEITKNKADRQRIKSYKRNKC